MIAAAILTAVTYILPLAAMAVAGLSPDGFSTGVGHRRRRNSAVPLLAMAVVAGGVICGIGMFNALMMSYTRLPMAMAADGMLAALFARRNRRGVPWVSVLFCGLGWALALKLPFERLISIDLILYGSSLLLEFVALIALRLREPSFRVPSTPATSPSPACSASAPPSLIAYALYASRGEKLGDPGTLSPTSRLFFSRLGLPCSGRCSTGSPPLRSPAAALSRCIRARLAPSPLQSSRQLRANLASSPWSLVPRPCLLHCHLLLRLLLLRLALVKLLDRVHHPVARIGSIAPALHLHPLALQDPCRSRRSA